MGRSERFADAQGAASLVVTAGRILLARVGGSISQPLAGHIGHRLDESFRAWRGGHVFLDASGVERWHSLALATMLGALLATRERGGALVMGPPAVAPWAVGAPSSAQIELAASREAFDAKLRAAAGRDYEAYVAMDDVLDDAEGQPPPHGALVYVFKSSNFERGWLDAQCSATLSRRPRESWACVARDDGAALRLARRAALVEWPRPVTRSPLAFSVRFVEAAANAQGRPAWNVA